MNFTSSRSVGAWRWAVGIVALATLWSTGFANATEYSVNVAAGTYEWTNAASFTPNGVPGIADTVVYNATLWGSTMTLNFNSNQSVGVMIFTNANAAHSHTLSVGNNTTAGVFRMYRQNQTATAAAASTPSGNALTITEFHDLGLYLGIASCGENGSRWKFTGDAKITYPTADNTANPYRGWASVFDFSGATSVYLARNPNAASFAVEEIRTRGPNATYCLQFGRSDNGVQTWTVEAGSHPVLRHSENGNICGVSKVGTGDVLMAEVDLDFPIYSSSGLNKNGDGWVIPAADNMYDGTIRARSLTVSNLTSTAAKVMHVGGRLELAGQAGLEAGGAGNGHALHLKAGAYDLGFFNLMGSWTSTFQPIEILPAGGDVYIESTGAGKCYIRTCSQARDDGGTKPRTNAMLIANTINLASTNSYLTDRNALQDDDGNAGGVVEFRGDFINRSTETNLFRTEATVLRAIGGLSDVQYIEAPSQDLGTSGPGTRNFELKRLALGQNAQGTTAFTRLVLRDAYDNHPVDAQPEALYVTTLELYAGSELFLNGVKLYCKNSGSWVQAPLGSFTPGDGTGKIAAQWPLPPPSGAVFTIR